MTVRRISLLTFHAPAYPARIDLANRAQYDGAPVFNGSLMPGRLAAFLLCSFLALMVIPERISAAQLAARSGGSTTTETSVPSEALQTVPDNAVTVFVFARDKKGQAVSDLTPDEIHLSADSVEQNIESFVPDHSTAVLLAVLVDVSGSRHDEKSGKVERNALSNFFHSTLHGGDSAAIIVFSERFSLLTDITSDQKELDQALEKLALKKPWGPTALYDAVFAAAGARISGRSGRRAILILSDFGDNASRHPITDAIEAAHKSQASIYCLVDEMMPGAILSKREEKRGKHAAEELSEQTGGQAFVFGSPESLASAIEQLAADLHDCYVLRFHPTNSVHDGRIHNLRLETSRMGVTLITSKVYFAPKD
jgi:Ca-activated chloride channel homolog